MSVEVSSVSEETKALCDSLRNLAERDLKDYGFSSYGKEKAVCSVPKPSLLKDALEKTARTAAESDRTEWIDRAAEVVCRQDDLGSDISGLVDAARRGMSIWEKSKEGLWSVALALPPVAAVSWVLFTGDPAVGTGVIAHLGALFGLGDLWATLAIPASLGLDAANRRFLETELKGLYEKWFDRKREPIRRLIEENITGRCIRDCVERLEATEAPLSRLREAVDAICNGEGAKA